VRSLKRLALELIENPWTYILRMYPTSEERRKILNHLLEEEVVIV